MLFSIITPSYRSSQWLRLCIASVADQQGVELEHIVQDSCSDDGTGDWLAADSRVSAYIEKDHGMYDAVNRGFRRAKGELLAYLNCDEQYLPGALKGVHDFFAANPGVDVALSDTTVTDSEGNYVCHRYSLVPRQHQVWVRFPAAPSPNSSSRPSAWLSSSPDLSSASPGSGCSTLWQRASDQCARLEIGSPPASLPLR